MIYEFEGRCPSKKQVLKVIDKAISEGSNQINIWWGENTITLEKQRINGIWCGWGWIRRISGQDIANDMSRTLA